MKATVDTKTFAEAIQWATKTLDTKDDKAYVALEVSSSGMGFLSHQNPTSYLNATFTVLESDVAKDSEIIALEGRFLSKLAGSLDWAGPADLELKDDILVLTSRSGKFTIPTLTVKVGVTPSYTEIGEVNGTEYFNAVSRLSKILNVANSALMPQLGSLDICFSKEDENVSIMGTDRYSLSEIIVEFSPKASGDEFLDKEEHILLPHESAVLIAAPKTDENVTVVHDEKTGKFGYLFPDGRIGLFSLKQADALDYSPMKKRKAEATNTATLETNALRKSIANVYNLSSDNDEAIYLEIGDDSVVVRDKSSTNMLNVPSEIKADEPKVFKFSLDTINRGFNGVLTSKVRLAWGEQGQFTLLQSVDTKDDDLENVFTIVNASQ